MKVLLVDDTTFIRMTLKKMLEKNAHEVIGEACNGYEAVQKYKLLSPDFVIMDISMPIMDGIEAVRQIRSYDATAQIIICSLQGQRANVMEAIKVGACSFLIKPIDEEKLLIEISKLEIDRKPLIKKEAPEPKLTPAQAIARNLMAAAKNNCEEEKSYVSGIEEGYLEARREIATNLYRAGIDIKIIVSCVELSEEDVLNLVKAYNL